MQDFPPTKYLYPVIAGTKWTIGSRADLETLWEEMENKPHWQDDERLPYWVDLWPASLALASWLYSRQSSLVQKTCVDMGCGLGLTALVGTALGAKVLAFDYEKAPLCYAADNAKINNISPPLFIQTDWRQPALSFASAQIIWAGDIIYERRFIKPVVSFLENILAPQGVVWIAEPGRNFEQDFLHCMQNRGFSCEQAACIAVDQSYKSPKAPQIDVHILELKK